MMDLLWLLRQTDSRVSCGGLTLDAGCTKGSEVSKKKEDGWKEYICFWSAVLKPEICT